MENIKLIWQNTLNQIKLFITLNESEIKEIIPEILTSYTNSQLLYINKEELIRMILINHYDELLKVRTEICLNKSNPKGI